MNFCPNLASTENHIPLKFSVCTKTVYVTLGQGLINLLLEPGSLYDMDDMRFDIWLHQLITHAAKDYNKA